MKGDNNPNRPHKAIISCMCEIHETLPTGECGKVKGRLQSFVLCVDGATLKECKETLKRKLEEFNE